MFEQETSGVVVRVNPQFQPGESEPDENRYIWSYTIEIENRSAHSVQLISRFWRLTDANGVVQEVRGPGVVGQQPVIEPGKIFRYSSAAPLAAPSGMMSGSYSMVGVESREPFDVAVPLFALDSPHQNLRAN